MALTKLEAGWWMSSSVMADDVCAATRSGCPADAVAVHRVCERRGGPRLTGDASGRFGDVPDASWRNSVPHLCGAVVLFSGLCEMGVSEGRDREGRAQLFGDAGGEVCAGTFPALDPWGGKQGGGRAARDRETVGLWAAGAGWQGFLRP